jgi:hypothetical protein
MSAHGCHDDRTELFQTAFEEQVSAEFKAYRAARRIAAGMGLAAEWNEGPASSFYDATAPRTIVGVHKHCVWVNDPAGGLVLTFAHGRVVAKVSERGAPSAETLAAVRGVSDQVAAAVSTASWLPRRASPPPLSGCEARQEVAAA